MINNVLKINKFPAFGKRDTVTRKQDRVHSVAIYGTSRDQKETEITRKLAASVSKKLAEKDFDVWTGGCTGVAESVNRITHAENPEASWAIHVERFLNDQNKKLRASGIYKEKLDTSGIPIIKASGPERTADLIRECDHAIVFIGGTGSQQELWSNLEAKSNKKEGESDNVCTNDLILINEDGFYDSAINQLDLIESKKFQLGNNPEKGKSLKKIIDKVVKVTRKDITDKSIEITATDIVNHIIKKANKKCRNTTGEEIDLYKENSKLLDVPA